MFLLLAVIGVEELEVAKHPIMSWLGICVFTSATVKRVAKPAEIRYRDPASGTG